MFDSWVARAPGPNHSSAWAVTFAGMLVVIGRWNVGWWRRGGIPWEGEGQSPPKLSSWPHLLPWFIWQGETFPPLITQASFEFAFKDNKYNMDKVQKFAFLRGPSNLRTMYHESMVLVRDGVCLDRKAEIKIVHSFYCLFGISAFRGISGTSWFKFKWFFLTNELSFEWGDLICKFGQERNF